MTRTNQIFAELNQPIDSKARRNFLAKSLATVAALGATACTEEPAPGRYTQADIDSLAMQIALEAEIAGRGMYGEHRYRGYQGLAQLPWFELDSSGALQCVDKSVPKSIDIHAHLGMSVLFEPKLDLTAKTPKVRHLLDCDTDPACILDLDVYANSNFNEAGLKTLQRTILTQGLWGNDIVRSQTIPNLLREMDAMRVEQSVLLPIKLDLPFGDNQTEIWRSAVTKAGAGQRLFAGFSIHPEDDDKLDQLRQFAESGFKVMKLHPTVQRFYPDDPDMMPVYQAAQELGVTIFFHGGRAGIEPEAAKRYAMPRHYEAALRDFPSVNFILGHAGARDFEGMLALAKRYKNAWLGIHGQSLTNLEVMIQETGGERLLFGTDWPFYHIASTLAKVLIVTDTPNRERIRERILRANALELFNLGPSSDTF